ncbi:hypothetical protein [Cellvibrio sp. PSBB006]|uniref:hypothetical protein n=1 Tax=Cellvibrio sp. PSBB006 TaxID=1987723 RepID=UPI000B3B139C|nr:hypothetical protein [Cellvibrio sp. PSBB006]ARU26096.1 hypothetical protein CBR65_00845 [Cellvibrio sp. PSBB006]
MKTYKVLASQEKFRKFSLSPYALLPLFPTSYPLANIISFYRCDLTLTPHWRIVFGKFIDPIDTTDYEVPNLSLWIGPTLVLSPEANRKIGHELLRFGELLPVYCGGDIFHLFNCLNHAHIDRSNIESEEVYDGNRRLLVEIRNPHPELIFKTRKNNYETLFCNVNLISLIETNGLTGLCFQEDKHNIY